MNEEFWFEIIVSNIYYIYINVKCVILKILLYSLRPEQIKYSISTLVM
jgi:hypothetical protein